MKTILFLLQTIEGCSIFFWFNLTGVPFYNWKIGTNNSRKKIIFLKKFLLIYLYPIFLAWAFWEAWLAFYTHQPSYALLCSLLPLGYFIYIHWMSKS